jgi:hypothetical protein
LDLVSLNFGIYEASDRKEMELSLADSSEEILFITILFDDAFPLTNSANSEHLYSFTI